MRALTRRHAVVAALAGLATAGGFGAASAQTWPAPGQTIRLIVPFSSGSATDGLARLLTEKLQGDLGTTFVIENKAGAFGIIASNDTLRSAPDGYTLMMMTNTTHSASPNLYKNATYDPVKDFTPISVVAMGQNVLVIAPNVQANSVAELIALAKARPGQLSVASASGSSFVAGELFKAMAGININTVPYKNNGQQITDLVSGRVSMVLLDQLNATQLMRQGKVKGLAVGGLKRSVLNPQLPTLDESGLKGFSINSWLGVAGPAGMKPEIVDRLNGALNKVVADKDFRERLFQFGYEPITFTPRQAADLVAEQLDYWAKVVKIAKLEKQ